jgi:hypothetical protein
MSNLDLWNRVRAVPDEAIREIGGGRLKGKSDINPMYRLKKLTEEFGQCGVGWYFEVIDRRVFECNGEVAVFVDINLYYKANGEWSKPVFGTGGNTVVQKEKDKTGTGTCLYLNDEAWKMATTDAISVASKELGIGADVYWEKDKTKYTDPQTDKPIAPPITKPTTTTQPTTTTTTEKPTDKQLSYAKMLGISLEGLATYHKVKVEDLTKEQLSTAINNKKTSKEAS